MNVLCGAVCGFNGAEEEDRLRMVRYRIYSNWVYSSRALFCGLCLISSAGDYPRTGRCCSLTGGRPGSTRTASTQPPRRSADLSVGVAVLAYVTCAQRTPSCPSVCPHR